MPTHVETLLTQFGLPAEDAAKIVALPEEEAKTFDPAPYTEKVKANYQTQFKNDPAFFNDIKIESLPPDVKKQIESGQYARATNVAKEKIARAFGFTDEEIKDLATEDFKSLDYFVPAIAEKYAKTKAGDKQLQADLIEARKRAEEYEKKSGPAYEKEIEKKYETQAEQKITGAIFNAALIGELSSIPGLKISASDIAKTAHDILQNKYSFQRVGDFQVELRQKANPEMKVLKNNSSQELTLKEALMELATERNWVDTKQDDSKGSGTVTVTPTNKGLFAAPHIQEKLSRKIAAEK